MKYAIILDSYPSSESDRGSLLQNLLSLKSQNIDVMLTSHHPCSSEIIENSTYFLYERENNFYYLDSHIINNNIKEIENPIFQRFFSIGEITFYDRIVLTGWAVAIISQFINATKYLWSKGYDFAFYMVGDCLVPEDLHIKIENILKKIKNDENYFIRNAPIFSSWYAPFFFGFRLTDNFIENIPNKDYSDNSTFQKYFPNCAMEDFMVKLFENTKKYVDEYETLDEIFGTGKWNMISSVMGNGSTNLHHTVTSSIFVNEACNEFVLVLQVLSDCIYNLVNFNIQISDTRGEVFFSREILLNKNTFYIENIDYLFSNREEVILKKQVVERDSETYGFEDTIIIKKEDLSKYSVLKGFIRHKKIMKLYDFTLFNNEYDTLDIRLKYMKNFIDKFFVCEINITHQSSPSEFYSKYFIENYPIARELIDQGRLEFVSLELEPSNEYFLVEVNHRKKFTEWVSENVNDEFIGILTDCDEIVSSDIMNHIQSIEGIKSLDMKMYYFAADNWSKNCPWRFPKIFKSSELKFFDFQSIRMFRQEDYISEMGWHFSAFGGIDRALDKLKSFSHTEFNNENHIDYQIIYNRARNREDIVGRLEYPCEEYDLNNYPADLKKLILDNKNISNLTNILKNVKES